MRASGEKGEILTYGSPLGKRDDHVKTLMKKFFDSPLFSTPFFRYKKYFYGKNQYQLR